MSIPVVRIPAIVCPYCKAQESLIVTHTVRSPGERWPSLKNILVLRRCKCKVCHNSVTLAIEKPMPEPLKSVKAPQKGAKKQKNCPKIKKC